MLQKKSVRLGCGLFFLAICALIVWAMSGGFTTRVGDITEGAKPLFALPATKVGVPPPTVQWLGTDGKEAVLFYYHAATMPQRVEVATGKMTPLFAAGKNPIASSVRAYRTDVLLSPNGRRLLYIARVHKKGGNGVPCVAELDNSTFAPQGKPKEICWQQSGLHAQIHWLSDSRRWFTVTDAGGAGDVVRLYDCDNTKDIRTFVIKAKPTRAGPIFVLGVTTDDRIIAFDIDARTLLHFDLKHLSAGPKRGTWSLPTPATFKVARPGIIPYWLSLDGSRLLWMENYDLNTLRWMMNPRWRWLFRHKPVRDFLFRQMFKDENTIFVSDATGRDIQPTFHWNRPGAVLTRSWTPDGSGILFSNDGKMYARPIPPR